MLIHIDSKSNMLILTVAFSILGEYLIFIVDSQCGTYFYVMSKFHRNYHFDISLKSDGNDTVDDIISLIFRL